jgi:hypothetical protein
MTRRARAMAHSRPLPSRLLGGEVLPAGEAVLAREHELRVALRQRRIDLWQVRPCSGEGRGVTGGNVAREFLCLLVKRLE